MFRGYTFLASAWLDMKDGIYGKARTILLENITQPLEYVAKKLDVYPYLDYHYSYSSGNYVKKNKNLQRENHFDHTNLKMACSFSGGENENGFVSKTHLLISGIKKFLNSDIEDNKLCGLNLILQSIKEINQRRQQMWKASKHTNYNDFRTFIMGYLLVAQNHINPNNFIYY